MAGYSAPIEVHYCKQSEGTTDENRIAPAPNISISPEIYYANDSIIGYTYNITLNGYANALRKELDGGSVAYGLDPTLDHMGDIRSIFSFNGGNLHIKQTNGDIIVAKGATIKSIQFNTSDNRWVNYSPYTIELEFNEVDFTGCSNNPSIGCSSSLFHSLDDINVISDNLVNIKKYKLKAFNDKWTFTTDKQIYENYSSLYNSVFKVSYTISATGKHYYVNDQLIPAWQQAKTFVQDRLYTQVKALVDGVLLITPSNNDGCSPSETMSELHGVDSSGGLTENMNGNYSVYNESITCSTSEADGTFSVTYNAVVKRYDNSLSASSNAALHSYTKNMTVSDSNQQEASASVQGTIQGLVRGGFIYINNTEYSLPQNGSFITTINSSQTKYSNALSYFLNKIGTKTDLLDTFKVGILGIDNAQLLIKNGVGVSPAPSAFSIDHNYLEGSISYSANYDKATASSVGRGYATISIVRNDPVDIIQEFVVPGRAAGPIIQKLNMKTPRTVSINISGASDDFKNCLTLDNLDICTIPNINISGINALRSNSNMIVTKDDFTHNSIDGSFSLNLELTYKTGV